VGQAKRWPGGVTAFHEEEVVAGLRAQVFRDVLELSEGDTVAAGQWLSSTIRGVGNYAPVSLMSTRTGLEKI
tara:strand:+ start:450 stop:665 length:216 start_codon:yes stop_codon:yes gene_type:complete